MSDCEYLDKCPVWARFNSDVKYIWINNYCKGTKQDRCVRKTMTAEGKMIPDSLLPNNTSLDD